MTITEDEYGYRPDLTPIKDDEECERILNEIEIILKQYLSPYPFVPTKSFSKTSLKETDLKFDERYRLALLQKFSKVYDYIWEKKVKGITYRDFDKRGTHSNSELRQRTVDVFKQATYLNADPPVVDFSGIVIDPYRGDVIQGYVFRNPYKNNAWTMLIGSAIHQPFEKIPPPHDVDRFGGSLLHYGSLPNVRPDDFESKLRKLIGKTIHKEKIDWEETLGRRFLFVNNLIMETVIATMPQGTAAVNVKVEEILRVHVLESTFTEYEKVQLYLALLTHADFVADRTMTEAGEILSKTREFLLTRYDNVAYPDKGLNNFFQATKVMFLSMVTELKPGELNEDSIKKTQGIRTQALHFLLQMFQEGEPQPKKKSLMYRIVKKVFGEDNAWRFESAMRIQDTLTNMTDKNLADRIGMGMLTSIKYHYFPKLAMNNLGLYLQDMQKLDQNIIEIAKHFIESNINDPAIQEKLPNTEDFADDSISDISKLFNIAIFLKSIISKEISSDPQGKERIQELKIIVHKILLNALAFRHAYMFKTALANQWEKFSQGISWDELPEDVTSNIKPDARHNDAIRIAFIKDGIEIPLVIDMLLYNILDILTSDNAAKRSAIHVKPGNIGYNR